MTLLEEVKAIYEAKEDRKKIFETVLEKWMRNTSDLGEYLAGDCYALAAAMYEYNDKKGELFIASEKEVGDHAFYCNYGKCYDANGDHSNKDRLISDAEMGFDSPDFEKVTFEKMIYIGNAKRLVEELVKDFRKIEERL